MDPPYSQENYIIKYVINKTPNVLRWVTYKYGNCTKVAESFLHDTCFNFINENYMD